MFLVKPSVSLDGHSWRKTPSLGEPEASRSTADGSSPLIRHVLLPVMANGALFVLLEFDRAGVLGSARLLAFGASAIALCETGLQAVPTTYPA
ncbi:hypothetical protein DYI37_01905 [Fulvimarina endophytica]|uniref:Uncharacterized protein n=1 Tax=Fulvimarina endophytica TaxID=2293836 RepID=A0A371XAG2_9HYPH|nr:hypothetical protein DYI37_01905 [Fulvimarina endophytica]